MTTAFRPEDRRLRAELRRDGPIPAAELDGVAGATARAAAEARFYDRMALDATRLLARARAAATSPDPARLARLEAAVDAARRSGEAWRRRARPA